MPFQPVPYSNLDCPRCNGSVLLPIPPDWQRLWWKCPACRELPFVSEDKCCVFCAYGDEPCARGKVRVAPPLEFIE